MSYSDDEMLVEEQSFKISDFDEESEDDMEPLDEELIDVGDDVEEDPEDRYH